MLSNFFFLLAQAAGDAAAQGAGGAAAAGPVYGIFDPRGATGKVLLAAAIIVASYVAGRFLSARLRMRETSARIGLVTFSLLASAVVIALGWPPRLGIDLSGGVILVYELKPSEKEGVTDELLKNISIRLDPGNVKQITVRAAGGNKRIEIIIPRAEPAEIADIKETITNLGTLEFLIVCNQTDHEDRGAFKYISLAHALPPNVNELVDPADKKTVVARWVPVDETRTDLVNQFTPRSPGDRVTGENRYASRVVTVDGKQFVQVLCRVNKNLEVNGGMLTYVGPGSDSSGSAAVDFKLNALGARRFGLLTQQNLNTNDQKRLLAVILNGKLSTAPTIEGVITSDGQIHGYGAGREGVKDRDSVVAILRAGKLPAELNDRPISEQRIDATLGYDNIIRGAIALTASLVAVLLFMLVYYRFWLGGVACFVLLANLVLTLGAMMTIRAAFSLPGLAGMVLSIGMAVDANVLIYERIREELRRGSALRMAIRNGYDRAMSTIIDSNLTTVLTAVILYAIGTDQIRGFSVVLILGLLLSMFTAIYCSRLVFDLAERKRWMKSVSMLQILAQPSVNWLRWGTLAMAASVVVIAVGMAAMVVRGKGMLDIDFTGGTKAQIAFEGKEIGGRAIDVGLVRQKVNDWSQAVEKADGAALETLLGPETLQKLRQSVETFLKDSLSTAGADDLRRAKALVDLPDVTITGIEPGFSEVERPLSFYLNTSNTEVAAVEAVLDQIFAGQLVHNSFKFDGKMAAVAPEEDPSVETPPAGSTTATTAASEPAWAGDIKFRFAVNHNQARDLLRPHLPAGTVLRLNNPLYKEGVSNAFAEWTLSAVADEDQVKAALAAANTALSEVSYFPETTNIGGAVAGDASLNALFAFLASAVGIIIYIWVRFQKVAFGVGAVVALIHDVLVTVGFLGLSLYLAPYLGWLGVEPFKINLEIVAALLTIMGFSINDTIVIFDRIREIRGKSPEVTTTMVNRAVNETMSRTIITSLTVFMTVLVMYFFGGHGSIHGFAYAMVVGVIAGTYSTVFIACPVMLSLLKVKFAAAKAGRAVESPRVPSPAA
ncbi:MAG: protein translocase subunit SecD [Planctomycetia bacterium]|nr:protein translocase subunit SecD [Planctomycetia bacterium]